MPADQSCRGDLRAWDGQHEASKEIDVVELKYALKKLATEVSEDEQGTPDLTN